MGKIININQKTLNLMVLKQEKLDFSTRDEVSYHATEPLTFPFPERISINCTGMTGLAGSSWDFCNLYGTVNFENTDLSKNSFVQTTFPGFHSFKASTLDGANFSKSSVKGQLDLTGVKMSETNLSFAKWYDATLENAIVINANLTGFILGIERFGQKCNCKKADFTGSIFDASENYDVDWTGSNFTKARFGTAPVETVQNYGFKCWNSIFDDANFTDAYISGSFRNCSFKGTIFDGTFLCNVMNLTFEQFAEAKIVSAYIDKKTLKNMDIASETLDRDFSEDSYFILTRDPSNENKFIIVPSEDCSEKVRKAFPTVAEALQNESTKDKQHYPLFKVTQQMNKTIALQKGNLTIELHQFGQKQYFKKLN